MAQKYDLSDDTVYYWVVKDRKQGNPENIPYKRIELNVMHNLIKKNFKELKLNQKLTTDITYLINKDKKLYLSTILNLYDRKVVVYQISKFNDINIVINTLNEAIAKRKDVSGIILHSVQEFQYTSMNTKLSINQIIFKYLFQEKNFNR